jgi:hypothetical protein
MNAIQEAKLKMFRATENYCSENAAIIAENIAFQTAFTEFKAKITSIVSTIQTDGVPLTGIAIDKNMMKQTLCERTSEIAGIVYAYAVTIGNHTLKAEVDCPVSSLTRLREDALAPRCQSIHDIAKLNLAELADYGVTLPMLAALQEAITKYSAESPKPRTAIAERKTTTARLAELFDETDAILKDRMDKLVVAFKAEHPDFVRTYEATRRIIKPPHTTTQLKVCVTDKTTKSPLKNAVVTVKPMTNGGEPASITTDSTGEALFKPTAHGAYTVTITANGFTTYENDEITVLMGEVNKLDVELVR